jgi:hypothetical protein
LTGKWAKSKIVLLADRSVSKTILLLETGWTRVEGTGCAAGSFDLSGVSPELAVE